MSSDNFAEIARKVAEQQRIMDSSFAATIKGLENSSWVRLQRELQDCGVLQFQKELKNSAFAEALKQADETAARMREMFDTAELQAAEQLRAFDLVAEQAAEQLRAFDSIALQAAERMRSVFDNSAAAQALANIESTFFLTAEARKYLDDQAAMWDRIQVRNALTHEDIPGAAACEYRIRAKVPEVRITTQAEQEYIPAPEPEPAIEMPSAANWFASALESILTKGAFKRTVEPHVADMCDAYRDAIRDGRKGQAAWVIVRGHLLIVETQLKRVAAALSGWFAILKELFGL